MHLIPDKKNLFIVGDCHNQKGKLKPILERISKTHSALILLGDYDIHTNEDMDEFKALLNKYPINYYLLRGNHDNPKFWQDKNLVSRIQTDRLHLLEEVDTISWRGKKILTISGAVSVDRTGVRTECGYCWPDTEGIPPDAISRIPDEKFDILLSHTGIVTENSEENELVESYSSIDSFLLDDLKKERKLIQKIQILSGVQEHYFGHFHKSWEGEDFGIMSRCLDICELVEIHSL